MCICYIPQIITKQPKMSRTQFSPDMHMMQLGVGAHQLQYMQQNRVHSYQYPSTQGSCYTF